MNDDVHALEQIEPVFSPGTQIGLNNIAVAPGIDIKQLQSILPFEMMPQLGPEISRGARDKDGLRFVHGFSRKEVSYRTGTVRTEDCRAFCLL